MFESSPSVLCVGKNCMEDSTVPTTVSLPLFGTLDTEPTSDTKGSNVANVEKTEGSSQTFQENHDNDGSQPAHDDDLEFDFDDFSPHEDCDLV